MKLFDFVTVTFKLVSGQAAAEAARMMPEDDSDQRIDDIEARLGRRIESLRKQEALAQVWLQQASKGLMKLEDVDLSHIGFNERAIACSVERDLDSASRNLELAAEQIVKIEADIDALGDLHVHKARAYRDALFPETGNDNLYVALELLKGEGCVMFARYKDLAGRDDQDNFSGFRQNPVYVSRIELDPTYGA